MKNLLFSFFVKKSQVPNTLAVSRVIFQPGKNYKSKHTAVSRVICAISRVISAELSSSQHCIAHKQLEY
jgi:hypothetical protein